MALLDARQSRSRGGHDPDNLETGSGDDLDLVDLQAEDGRHDNGMESADCFVTSL